MLDDARPRGGRGGNVEEGRECATVVRRFAGTQANELTIACRPRGRSREAPRQADALYRDLSARLAAEGASARHLTSETLFVRDVRRDLPLVLDARARALADLGQDADAPAPAFIQQPPLDPHARVELLAAARVPRDRTAWSVRDVCARPSCACAGCAATGLRLVHLGDQTSLHTTNVYGAGQDAFAEAFDMFCQAEGLLARCGVGFGDVVRTWIHLRDIGRDYDALNAARREFFRQRGVDPRPASTGVQGVPFPDGHDVSLRLQALQSTGPLARRPMSTPALSEAWTYGADFSRGLRVVEASGVTLHVSGTASIDEAGRSAHPGDLGGQIDRMLHNIESLLAAEGATFADVVSGVVYLRRPTDAPLLRAMCRERGFDGFPCALVEAPLCRPELLCEAEAVALLPLT